MILFAVMMTRIQRCLKLENLLLSSYYIRIYELKPEIVCWHSDLTDSL